MAIKISAIIIILVAPAALAQNVYTGYDYRMPSASLQLSSNLRSNIQQPYYSQTHELQNGFLPSPAFHQPVTGSVYKNQETQQAFRYNNQGFHSVQPTYQTENYNRFTPNFNRGNLAGTQNAQQAVQASPTRNPSFHNVQPQQPVITKHIYFHLPPPDDTVTSAPVTQRAPKKTYKIIFIMLPSQKSASAARLQQLFSQQAVAESKTLIYVLVKKPETQPTQPSVTSKPEVFFVKYKEPRNVAQPVNSGLVQVQAPQRSTFGLLPGQINGHADK